MEINYITCTKRDSQNIGGNKNGFTTPSCFNARHGDTTSHKYI